MSRIRSRNTKPEMLLRAALWAKNIRFRTHSAGLPGKPDIVIKKYSLAIFVDGSFWHGYNWQVARTKIKTNTGFWTAKIEGNIERDKRINRLLGEQGYTVMRFWDHQITGDLHKCVNQVILYVESSRTGKIPDNLGL